MAEPGADPRQSLFFADNLANSITAFAFQSIQD
jgi:hypothetical protein